jgi:hypothetical protein
VVCIPTLEPHTHAAPRLWHARKQAMPWARNVAQPSAALPPRASVADLRVHSLYYDDTASDLAVKPVCVWNNFADSQSAVVGYSAADHS